MSRLSNSGQAVDSAQSLLLYNTVQYSTEYVPRCCTLQVEEAEPEQISLTSLC